MKLCVLENIQLRGIYSILRTYKNLHKPIYYIVNSEQIYNEKNFHWSVNILGVQHLEMENYRKCSVSRTVS